MLRLGLLGVGHLGKIHLNCIQALGDRVELTAFFDPQMNRAKEAMDMTGIMPSHSVDHVLDQVDAVIIAAPTANHFELAIKAANSDFHLVRRLRFLLSWTRADTVRYPFVASWPWLHLPTINHSCSGSFLLLRKYLIPYLRSWEMIGKHCLWE